MTDPLQQEFERVLSEIQDPTTGKDILSAELVHGCVVNQDFAKLTLILPKESPLRDTLPAQVEKAIIAVDTIERVAVEVVEAPPKESAGPQSSRRPVQQPKRTAHLQNYDAVIAVASGKGGVGKSTVSVNLALALAQQGHRVSIFDADIYGPSIPIMLGMGHEKPALVENQLIPIERYGLDAMSIGNLIDEDASMVWRGPMVHQAIEQLLGDTKWPGGDFMILDLPPGTGDVQLTLSQACEITGAVIVSTPQDVALLDAMKAINMFSKVNIPILGIVENMSQFVCPHCDEATAIFSSNGAQETSKAQDIPFLGEIPIELAVREGGDSGKPIMLRDGDSPAMSAFRNIAKNLTS